MVCLRRIWAGLFWNAEGPTFKKPVQTTLCGEQGLFEKVDSDKDSMHNQAP